jgi:hypothetical protein
MKYNTEAIEEVVVAVVKDFAAYYKDVVDMFLENRLDDRGQFIMNELYKDIKDNFGYDSNIVNTILKEG